MFCVTGVCVHARAYVCVCVWSRARVCLCMCAGVLFLYRFSCFYIFIKIFILIILIKIFILIIDSDSVEDLNALPRSEWEAAAMKRHPDVRVITSCNTCYYVIPYSHLCLSREKVSTRFKWWFVHT